MISRLVIALLCAAVLAGSSAVAQTQSQSKMLNTKHNLGISGPGALKAKTNDQLCLFCHTPHVPTGYAAPQLWNHQMSSATYTLYSSDYLTSKGYTPPSDPNPASKLCLSCHDGTVALGAVYNFNGAAATIEMANNVTTMPANAAGNLGTSLANDHPVGYVYDPSVDPELVARSWPWRTPVKLDPDQANGTVECHTCHDPHDNTNAPFLRVSNTNAALCTFCHTKSGWQASGHKNSQQPFTTPAGTTTTVGEWACRSCHESHGGAGVPYLLPQIEEATCYTSGCHGRNGTGQDAKDVETATAKPYAHPTASIQGKHKNPDTQVSLSMPNRHAECSDCHNNHQAQRGLHAPRTNLVSNALLGVSGLTPGLTSNWTQPTTYTLVPSATQENQICFKCHSYYALGPAPNGVTTLPPGPSGAPVTDQAMEFNPGNKSTHPVAAAITSSLTPEQLGTDWQQPGSQTMYCSDCHGNDETPSSTVPQGPHGSDSKFMLTGRGKLWPLNGSGTPWTLDDVRTGANNAQNDLFCINCHPMVTAGVWANNVHEGVDHQSAPCIACHVAVPHGAKRSRLIGYQGDPVPYDFGGTGVADHLMVTGFQKSVNPKLYSDANCSTAIGCHTGPPVGPYEP